MDPFATLLDEAKALLPDAVALRRRLHEQPELGLDLPLTQRAVLEALDGLDLEIETGGRTSAVVATLRGAQPGSTLLLRADMDALPMREETGLPFASERPDAMHACGHDAHVAMLAAAARLLAAHRHALAGQVKLLFQPGEEGHGGARILVEEGLLDREPRVDAAFALHVNPTQASGTLATRPGPILAASDVFSLDLVGASGHASMPHEARDPIPAAAELVLALQSLVTRRFDAFDPVVLTVTRVQAGASHNTIPEQANLLGTVRSLSAPARAAAEAGVRRAAAGVASAHGLEARVHWLPGYPVTHNDPGFARFVLEVGAALLGPERAIPLPAPLMGAEDFSYILARVPGALAFLGVRPPGAHAEPLHSTRMVLDEDALAVGIATHAAVALRALAPGAGRA